MATVPPQQPPTSQPADVQQDQLTIGRIVEILTAYLAAHKTLELLSKLLNPLGIAADAVRVAWKVGGRVQRLPRADASRYRAPRGTALLRRPGQGNPGSRSERTAALRATLAGEDTFRAAYLYAAARRVQRALDQAARNGQSRAEALAMAETMEQRFYAQHRAAQAKRRQQAARVDVAALRHGVPFVDPVTLNRTRLVGWHATLDDRTSPECRRASGNNFPVNRPPAIGWPGAVHPSCRCKPGAPFANGRLLDSVIPTRRAA